MEDTTYKNTRKIRKERNMTLKELSELSGLSVSFLSKYENGKTSITVASLLSIARALDVSIKVLLAPEEDEEVLVVRRQDRVPVIQNKAQHTTQEFLTMSSRFNMQVTVMHMPPHSHSGGLDAHDGEEFLFILKGRVTLNIEGRDAIMLDAGDMAYYDSHLKHGWRNDSDEHVSFLAVTAKNVF